MPNPWDNDPIVTPAARPLGGRPIIRKGVEPQPKTLKGNFAVDLNSGTAKPVEGLPNEHWRPLAPGDKLYLPNHPGIINEQTGEIRYGPEGPTEDAKTAATAGDPFQNDVLLKQIGHVRELAKKPFSLGAGTGYLSYVPIIGQNAADMRAALQQVQGDLIQRGIARLRELNNGKGAATLANTEKEGERIAASFAALSPDQSPEEFLKGLDDAEAFYRRAVTQTQAAPAAAAGPQSVSGDAQAAPDAQMTRSNTLPPTGVDDGGVQSSAKFKTVVDPKAQKIAGRILSLVNQGASRNQVMGFAVGADPKLRKDPVFKNWVDGALRLKAKDPRATFTVSPEFYTKRVPLDAEGVVPGTSFLSEQDRAAAAASKPGAVASGMADTASLGASRDLAGLIDAASGGSFSEGRRDFADKQNMIAFERPGETFAGEALGGLVTLPIGAPATFPRLVGQSGGLGALYGALSADDPSLGGRFTNAVTSGATSAAAAATFDPALRVAGMGARRGANGIQRLLGVDPEAIADAGALRSFASHAPEQSLPEMRARLDEQSKLDATPTGLTTLDRAGQDYLGRQAARSPAARQVADEAVTTAQERLPAQLEADFAQAIDDAADGKVASFLKRPAREITGDIQGMAGREYEKGIAPIANEKLGIDGDLAETLGHERIRGAISDALSSHTLSDETRQVLRQLPRDLQALGGVDAPTNLGANASAQIAAVQQQVRDQALKNIPLTVDAARNLATALDRTASRLADGSEGGVELRRLSRSIREKIGEQYPEFQPVNARYASRMRAIGALEDARTHFLGDTTGRATDDLARATGRHSDVPGEPEFGAEPVEGKGGFKVDRGPQPMPSEKQMAVAGAKEAAVAKAANGGGAGSVERLSTPGQKERNRMILGERAKLLEARSKAQAANVRTTERLSTSGLADDSSGKMQAAVKAGANAVFHRGGAMVASALSGIRGMGPQDTARVVKLYTDPGKAEQVVASLEKAYGRRKARFIIARIGAFATAASKTKPLPDEAVAPQQ